MEMPGERGKHAWRNDILTRRNQLSTADHDAEAQALAETIATVLSGPVGAGAATVAAYVPVRGEPGDLRMLDALTGAGATVLLPVTGELGPLSWAVYTGAEHLVRRRFGLREPDGHVLPPATLGRADVILVPALAVDRRGVRLGRGAGYYDRSLELAAPAARLIAVVRDEELVPVLPEEPHDRRVGWALTPSAGSIPLGAAEGPS
ncbi:5-formyltetrahydrofolate cyclo-ligase [Nocardia harenae]|uniref:5-formyltetrahydrofolate cyclo-ligase n=1 Tax=Nocardia harenae TaxID=358707 RepID=UPI000832A214|nr:5-formyltetrahydrofolate cyclo-ligase [Nocardia harenae]